jgi:lauroyl/myristoyl acyltransferase
MLTPVPQDDRVRELRLPVRLYTSGLAHRLVPARAALAIAAAVGTPGQRHDKATERRQSEHLMKDLLLHTPRAGEARQLARRNVQEASRLRELFWRPWLLKDSRIVGREHWDAAHNGGRGCVLVLGHLGGSFAVSGILGRHGFDVHMVSSAHFWRELPPGLTGQAHRFLREEYGERALGAHRLIPNDAPPERLVELVEAGATVGIAFDVPGSAATPFLGRSVALASGPASLAFRTKAKVLPVICERHGTRIDLRMLEPLDAADHRDLRSLRAAIAKTYEPLIVAKPEMVEVAWYPSPLVTEALSSQAPDAPQVGV